MRNWEFGIKQSPGREPFAPRALFLLCFQSEFRNPHSAMYCPNCGELNLPGAEACRNCQQSLTSLDSAAPHDRVEQALANDPVSVLPPGPPVTVPVDARLGRVMTTMMEHGVGAVLVVNADGTLAGILTERDFLIK